MIPSVVVFDLGKVLVDFDYGVTIRRFLSLTPLSLGPMRQLLGQSRLLLEYERGRMTTAEFFARVRDISGFQGDLPEFKAMFDDVFTGIPSMIALHAEIRARGTPTYIFSNTNELAVEQIRRCFPFFGGFNGYILSYEHGALKPEARLYEVVERTTGRQGPEIFYLDDRPENIDAGALRGWQAILHQTPETSRQAAVSAGLLDR